MANNFYESMEKRKSANLIIADVLLANADIAITQENFEYAVQNIINILKLLPIAKAKSTLANLYSQGKGIEQNFKEASYWFHQAELSGDEHAEKLCWKNTIDFINKDFELKNPEQLYWDMFSFVKFVYPEEDAKLRTNRNLYTIAEYYFKEKKYELAVKLFRAAAEFGDDGLSQNYISIMYRDALGIERNDLASLYWIDKASDNGIDIANEERIKQLEAYVINCTDEDFYKIMILLSNWCLFGCSYVPRDAKKANQWRLIAEKGPEK